MAKYHDLGRFSLNENDIDWDSAVYHEEHAAQLGVLEAILTMARIYLDLQRDVLSNCTVQVRLLFMHICYLLTFSFW